ncbi:MAG: peptide-methionine (R)-S-oxide reductase, partial [Rhizomicrobium sp.]
MTDKIEKSDEEWRKQLTPTQFAVTRQKATERPFTGEYDKTTAPGTYRCICCGEILFESDAKFDAGCGWPSFSQPAAAASVAEERDRS